MMYILELTLLFFKLKISRYLKRREGCFPILKIGKWNISQN